MRRPSVQLPGPFVIAASIASVCVAAALVAITLAPLGSAGVGDALRSEDRAWLHALTGAALVGFAGWLRSRQEATAYAVLAWACLNAGWAADVLWSNSVDAQAPLPWVDLVSRIALGPATTAIVAIFASTPERRLARLVPSILSIIVALGLAAAVAQTWLDATGFAFGPSFLGVTDALLAWMGPTSALAATIALCAAMLGSLRNEAQRFIPTAAAQPGRPDFSRSMAAFATVALGIAVVTAFGWAGSEQAASGVTVLPILAALVALIAARWSGFVAWAALAISLAVSAGANLSGAVEIEARRIVPDDPPSSWMPSALWLVAVAFAVGVAILGIAAASRALRAARRGTSRRERGTVAPVVLMAVTIAVAAWSTLAWLVGPGRVRYPLLEMPGWAAIMLLQALAGLLVVGAAEAARGRLVPAIAEAESVARRPLRPFRYLETVVIEALTGRGALRRSAAAAERARLASDLHAEILPSLAEITAQYEAGTPGEDVAARLRQLEREVRDLMAERRLVVLEEFGIVEAIEWLVGRAEERASLEVQLSVDDRTTAGRPPREVERAAFRIAQLAIENALQHAAPTRLDLAVLARADEVRISVVDDGRGFARSHDDRSRDHLGISDMRSQAADVHGDVQVVSPATGGTIVTFAWPAA